VDHFKSSNFRTNEVMTCSGARETRLPESVKVFYLCFISPLDMHPKQSSQAWGYALLLQFRAYIPFFIMTASSSRTEHLLRVYIYHHQSARGPTNGNCI
jgi:hypothetical protein